MVPSLNRLNRVVGIQYPKPIEKPIPDAEGEPLAIGIMTSVNEAAAVPE